MIQDTLLNFKNYIGKHPLFGYVREFLTVCYAFPLRCAYASDKEWR